jgi:hypothetical protein
LTLPGETDRTTGKPQSFLLIKLIEPPPMTPEQPPQPTAAQPELGRGITRDDLDVIIEALEYRCDAIEGGTDFDEVTRLKSLVPTLEKVRALEAPPLRPESERYEELLRATAALRYPYKERTPKLQARIEKTIARKVGEFTQECQVRAYEQSLRRQLAEKRPNLSPTEREHYEQRIVKLVSARPRASRSDNRHPNSKRNHPRNKRSSRSGNRPESKAKAGDRGWSNRYERAPRR